MSPSFIARENQKNYWKTILYLVFMSIVMGALGYAFLGLTGLLWAAGFSLLFIGFGRRVPTDMIMRFYRGRPLHYVEAPDLFSQIAELTRRAGLDAQPRLFLIHNRAINAFATGQPGDTAIGITTGLLRSLSARERYGVLAHEMSHIKNNDLRFSQLAMFMNRITRMFAFVAQVLLIVNLPLLLAGQAPFSFGALILLMVAPWLSIYLQLAISRTRELDADLQAAKLTGDPHGLANALERIEWFSNPPFQRLFQPIKKVNIPKWLRTHPSTEERVQRLRSLS